MSKLKQARKTNLDWKGVTPFVQARDILYNGDSKSILRAARIFQLECKESVECYCTETHMGVTFDWLAVTQAWLTHVKDKQHVKMKFQKGQELSYNKLTAGIGGEKGKKRGAGLKEMKLSLYSVQLYS